VGDSRTSDSVIGVGARPLIFQKRSLWRNHCERNSSDAENGQNLRVGSYGEQNQQEISGEERRATIFLHLAISACGKMVRGGGLLDPEPAGGGVAC
tara:strand:- start:309 stop:596 length:288 start_codon:yes stop_codon:yes gene_type:complete